MKIILTAGPPAYGGYTVARQGGKVVMLRGAIPGEVVEAEVLQEKKDYSLAAAVNILEPSPERVEPPCRYFGVCGGCQIQYASYPMQVRMKEDVLASTLKRIGKMEIPLSEPLTGQPWNYRHRGQFKIVGGRMGYFRERSKDLVDINRCPLMTEEINEAFINAKRVLKNTNARELHILRGDRTLALIRGRSTGIGQDLEHISGLLVGQGFAGVRVEAEGGKPLIIGAERLNLELDGLSYSVSAGSFFQANWNLNRALVGLVLEGLAPIEGKTVLDLYSGAGNFALPVSRLARMVVAVEEGRSAVRDGKENAIRNGIKNCEFAGLGVDGFKIRDRFDAVIADPPRAGMSEEGIEKILSMSSEKVAYVSCNPATLARDLSRLKEDYAVESVRLIDFFPQTYHIEALALLTRRRRS
ncbi:MAG: class I SAM-dependent RNA methyltransferase [Nitrospirota bacterium]